MARGPLEAQVLVRRDLDFDFCDEGAEALRDDPGELGMLEDLERAETEHLVDGSRLGGIRARRLGSSSLGFVDLGLDGTERHGEVQASWIRGILPPRSIRERQRT